MAFFARADGREFGRLAACARDQIGPESVKWEEELTRILDSKGGCSEL